MRVKICSNSLEIPPFAAMSAAMPTLTSSRTVYLFGPFRLDASDLLLAKGPEDIPITRKAAETLLVLLECAGHVVAKETLLERVWPGTFVEESTLAQNILTLRKALGKQPDGRDYIGTIPKRGYRFEALVAQEPTAEAPASSIAIEEARPPVP